MRVSTAITFALTALLIMSLLGAVAVAPVAADPSSDGGRTAVAADRSHPTSAIAPPSDFTTAHRSGSFAPSISSATAVQSDTPSNQTDPDTRQIIRLTVQDNGDVRWSIESHFRVTSDEDAAEFRDYAAEVEASQDGAPYDFGYFRRTAEQTTGREMSIEDAGWDDPRIVDSSDVTGGDTAADEDVRIGIISYSVTWTNFATVEGDRVHFGDAFRTDSGTWMELYQGQRLVVETQSNFALETPTQLTWDGPYRFTADELEIVFVRTGNGGGSGSPLDLSWWWPLVIGGIVVTAGIGGYLLFRRDDLSDLPIPTERFPALESIGIGGRSASERTSSGDASDGTGPATGAASSTAKAPDRAGIDDGGSGTGTHLQFEEPVTEDIDPELLSDEERVLRMLERNGGRMKQATIVSETGWSNAKVSQLLSKMDDDDEIEKLRIGRENLITLPGVDPTKTN
ncbi:helix-turn-helix transcriptional regulator [Natrinema soli]|uniref:Helix-turn-helix transcriptional regulator n=1 Tax=Natrinema soli TaxID=1930624 RepID=A0ABD5SIS8_9EURY|nr:hypothetical protein [Natrinema soli]